MDQAALENLLNTLIATWENETIEFKEVGDNYSVSEIGKYFSALANEANLRNKESAWLVFGVNDKSRSITYTDFRIEPERLQETKKQIVDGTQPKISFRNIHVLSTLKGKRVVLFEIPPAPRGMPVAWHGHHYGRSGESLLALSLDKVDEIRQQTLSTDWSAQIISGSTLEDLDKEAVRTAQMLLSQKYTPRIPEDEIKNWPLETFLDRTKLTRDGKVTRTTLLLLGKTEVSSLLSPHPAQLTWKLEGEEKAYEHFSIPFMLTTTQLYHRIRNIQIRLLPAGELFQHEISKYDQSIVLEALHNCIAHQDYTRNGRIIVTEKPDKLVFENEGDFYEGQIDDYVLGEKTPRRYRNPFLVQAMTELGMIDTMGYGIHRMHKGQAKRYLPLPDYDLAEENAVRMTIYGGVVDLAYTQMLMRRTDLELADILALDRIQKKRSVPNNSISRLRHLKLIEGRKPNWHVSAVVADATNSRADYIRTRALDDTHYKKLIVDYLERFKKATRAEIDAFLKVKLSDALNDNQKATKIGNLLSKMRQVGIIENKGSRKLPIWILTNKKE